MVGHAGSSSRPVRASSGNPKLSNANTLIKALENFVIPLIQGSEANDMQENESQFAGEETRGFPVLTHEARTLLAALEGFVASLARISSDEHDAMEVELQHGQEHEAGERHDVNMPMDNEVQSIASQEEPPLFKRVIERAHEVVFNVIPIRLLSFDATGGNIKLVDRAEIWRRILPQIERELDVNKMMIDIVARTSKTGKAEASTEAEAAVIDLFVRRYIKYAILSHTWLQGRPGEVTHGDWNSKAFMQNSAGFTKLTNFCRVAATTYNITLGWIDTICINKDSSSELDESIRSMFKWYEFSEVCIAYLGDTVSLETMHNDTWFTRGWTLQELIAPPYIKFYTADWMRVVAPARSSTVPKNDKRNNSVLRKIRKATGITETELKQQLREIPVSRRMQWAAHRRVTREEDTAYSLMGIFEVSISTAYGEGADRAFVRLVKEIMNTDTPNVVDIVNWGYGPSLPLPGSRGAHSSSLIPRSPKYYTWRVHNDIKWYRPTTPVMLTQLGLRLPILMMPAIMVTSAMGASMQCEPYGSYSAVAVDIDLLSRHRNVRCTFNILDRRLLNTSAAKPRNNLTIKTFGVLNITDTSTSLKISEDGFCFAVMLDVEPVPVPGVTVSEITSAKRLPTMQSVVFKLKRHGTRSYTIPKNELGLHGMSLHNIYL